MFLVKPNQMRYGIFIIFLISATLLLVLQRLLPSRQLNQLPILVEVDPLDLDITASEILNEETEQKRDSTIDIYFHDYVIENRGICTSGKQRNQTMPLALLLLVASKADNFEVRQCIRETWGTIVHKNSKVRLAFLLGSMENATLQNLVEQEQGRHSDLIQKNFLESYKNLSLKAVMMLQWVNDFCPDVEFVMKTDDDTYINTDKLLSKLESLQPRNNVIYGYMYQFGSPIRDRSSKWFVSVEEYPWEEYPQFVGGSGYVMSRDTIPKLLLASYFVPFLHLEAVFITGMCAEEADVQRIGVAEGLMTPYKLEATGCLFKNRIFGHYVAIEEMRIIWKDLQNPDLECMETMPPEKK